MATVSSNNAISVTDTTDATVLVVPENERSAVIKTFTQHADFPRAGILFYDIFPLFTHPSLVHVVIKHFAHACRSELPSVKCIIGLESRGFILGALLASELNLPFVPVRKAGKLPGRTEHVSYNLEYGSTIFEMQMDHGCPPGTHAVLVDDLLATGGSLAAAAELAGRVGFTVVASLVMIELDGLSGASRQKQPTYTFWKTKC